MSFSLEARVPYLDYRLVETGLALGAEALTREGMTKLPLRKAMTGIVPAAITDRYDKQGFSTDEAAWMRGELGDLMEEHFRSGPMRDRGFFDTGRLLELLSEHRAGADHSAELWRAFCAERWLRLFIDPARLAAPMPAAPEIRARDHLMFPAAADLSADAAVGV